MKTNFRNIDDILVLLPGLPDQLQEIQETLITNLIMIGEIPSPTFEEEARIKLFLQRMVECGLENVSVDVTPRRRLRLRLRLGLRCV